MNQKVLLENRVDQDIRSLEEFRQKPILTSIKNTYEWLFLVYVVGKDGYMTARSDDNVVLSRTTNLPVYVLCAPFDTSAFCFAMNLSNVSANILNTKIGETGFAFFVYTDNTGKKIISYTKDIENNWTLVIQQDYDEAYTKLNNAKYLAIIIFVITLLITLILAILISRSISKPIVELTNITNAYSKGEVLNGSVPGVGRGDEIGSLARGITRMGKSIEVMLKRVYEG